MGGERLGSVFTDFLAASGLVVWGGGRVGPLRWVLWLAAVCLGISV